MTDKEFIQWIHDRLQFVHHENENMDYMHKLRAFIAAMPDEITTLNVESLTAPAAPHAQAEPVGKVTVVDGLWSSVSHLQHKPMPDGEHELYAVPVPQEAEPVGYVVDNDKGESIINVSLPVGTQVFTRKFAAQEAKQAASAAGQWRPIETAPKGARGYSWMMLKWGDKDDPNTAAGMRHSEKFFASATFHCLGQEKQYEFREVEVKPTHWMPMPDDSDDWVAQEAEQAAPAAVQAMEFALGLAEQENDVAAVSFLKAWYWEDSGYLRANWPDFDVAAPAVTDVARDVLADAKGGA